MQNRYPQEAVLGDGRRVLVRPFAEQDPQALYEFFQRLPEDTRRFAWHRLDDQALVESWGQNLDYSKVFPLLALDGSRIIADASLHCRDAGPLRLVGRIKWLIDADWRDAGLGTLMVNHLIGSAQSNGLRFLSCMLISDLEQQAIKTLEGLGFESHSWPDYGTDPDGNQHDMTKLVLKL